MADFLDDYSPWQTGLGRFMNMARIPLGTDRGWLELHDDGYMELFTVDYPDEPVFRFNAQDGAVLIQLGKELSGMVEAWEEYKLENTEPTSPGRIHESDDEDDEDAPTPPTGGKVEEKLPTARKMAPTTLRPVGHQDKLAGLGAGAD